MDKKELKGWCYMHQKCQDTPLLFWGGNVYASSLASLLKHSGRTFNKEKPAAQLRQEVNKMKHIFGFLTCGDFIKGDGF